jgi:hypothetical protein
VTKPRERYSLTIETLPDETPAVSRLKRVVKALLRHYGFRLLAAVELHEDSPVTDPKPDSGDFRC